MAKKLAKKPLKSLHYEELEQRVLFSADVAPVMDPVAVDAQMDAQNESDDVQTEHDVDAEASDQIAVEPRWELVFVNDNVADYEQLIADLQGNDDNRIIEVAVLESDRDGIEQVSEILADRTDLSAVHFITHGADGEISMGDSWLNSTTLQESSNDVVGWGSAFTETGDILFYGCNIAADSDGQTLLDDISELTGAEVAASDDRTGSSELGGDWDLEYQQGDIETSVAVSSEIQDNWAYVLATSAPIQAANTGSTVAEGGTDTIANTELSYTDSEQAAADINYTVTTTPANGQLELTTNPGVAITNFTQGQIDANQVVYFHDGSETTSDEFKFDVDDGQGNTTLGQFVTGFANETNLTNNAGNDSQAVWSPDGTQITFLSDRDGNNEIYVMDADGSNEARLTNDAGADQRPSWSPDGAKIVFKSYRDGNGEIYVMNADGSNQTRLTNNAADDSGPAWSPDGTKILFKSDRDGNGEIYVMDADGTNQTRITNNAATDSNAAWSPDGTQITFVSDRDGNDEIYVMDADGSNQMRITNNAATDTNTAWSPDGTKILFRSNRDGNDEIYVMDADGSNQTRLTSNAASEVTPHWSPDGSQIVFATNRDVNNEIYVADVLHENRFAITVTPVNDAPTFIDGSIGYWNFDEGSGDSTAESAIGISTGTLGSTAGADANDPTWTTGKFGQALHFDGINDYVEVVDAPGIDISGPEFSASLWMNPDSGPNTEDMLFMKGDRQGIGNVNYYLSWKDTGQMTWAFKSDGGFEYLDIDVTLPTVGEWNHIAVVFDRPTVSLYINGTEYTFNNVATGGTSMDKDLVANDEPLWIGAGRSGGVIVGVDQFSGPFSGAIDDFAIFDRALTDAEIEAIRTSTPPAVTASAFSIDENSANNTVVGTVVANDQDIGDTLSYVITAGNTGGAFSIDANGQIKVANSAALDFETNPVFNLTIEATDDGTPNLSDTTSVTISLNDVNDAPTYSSTALAPTWTENGGAVSLFSGTSIDAIEAGDLINALTIDVTGLADGGDEILMIDGQAIALTDLNSVATAGNGYDVSVSAPGSIAYVTITRVGGFSAAAAETLVDGLAYDNASEAPQGAGRMVTLGLIQDDGGTANGGQNTTAYNLDSIVTIVAVNDTPIAVVDGFTVNEGSTTNLDLAANDSDADDGLDLASIAIVSGPANGSVVVNADGTVDYTHDGSETVADSFTYTIDDIAGATSNTVTVSLTITPVNDVPVAVADSFTVSEGSTTNLDLATNDTDTDDGLDLTSIAIVTGPANGSIVVNADGTVDYTHDGSETVADSFTYTIDDIAAATSNTVMVSLTITPVNDAPVARDDRIGLVFDGVDDYVRIGDYPGLIVTNNLTMEAWIKPTGLGTGTQLIINKEGEYELGITAETGEIMWAFDNSDPDWGWHNTGYFAQAGEWTHLAVTYDNGVANTYANGVLVDTYNGSGVLGDNYPTFNELRIGGRENATTQRFNGQIDEVCIWNTTRAQVDIQNDMNALLTGAEPGLIGNWRFDEGTGTIVVDQSALGHNGTLADGVTAGEMPVWQGYVVNEDSTLNVSVANGVLANDFDVEGDPLTAFQVSGPSNASAFTLNADGSFTYTPVENFYGIDSFTYRANDGSADSNIATVTIRVEPINDAPVSAADSFTVDEGSTTNLDLAANDTDVDDGLDLTSIAVVSGPANGSIVVNADGTVDYTHDGSETVADSFTYTIDDLSGATSSTVTVSLTISPINDAPIAVTDSFTVNEGSTINLNLAANDTDTDDGLDLASIAIVVGPANGSLVVNANGTVDYTHDGSETLADSFTYTIDDLIGATSNTVTVNLTIAPVNDVPIAAADSFTVNEGSTTNLDLAANDSDADDGLDLTSIAIVTGPANGSIVVNADGTVDYTHDDSETVADSFTYTIDDLAVATSNTVTVSLTITPVNDAPIAVADSFTVNEGATTSLDLATNDTDADDGLDLTSIAIASGPANGSIVVNADGTVDYTHDGSETVADSFTYTIDDLAGATSNTVTVSLTISPINDAPIATADGFTVDEGSTTNLDLAANDTDADDGLDLASISIVSGPANGSIVVNADGTVDYTHDGSETVADSFTYTIDDLAGATSNTVMVSLTITPVNDVPIGVADSFTVNEGSTTNLDLAANDTDADDGLDLTSIAIVSGPANGSIVVNADGTVDYTHDGSETVADSFTYTIDDLSGATSNTVTVTLTITPVNDAPIAVADSFTVNEGSTTNLDMAANDTDADDGLDLTSIAIVSGPANGSIVVNADGAVDYTHDGSETIADSFTYTIDDLAVATSNTVTVSLTITPVNDVPIAVADSFTVNEDSTTNLDLATNDTDADDGLDLTSIAIVSGPANGFIVVNADGTVDYTHDGSETVADSFTYTIGDLAGATSNTITVSLTVTPVNDAPIAVADSFTVNEGSTTNLDLAANDTDADDGLDLTSIAIVSGPTNGSIVVNADGTVDYTHDGSETIADSFTYTIDDLAGAISNTVTVSLTITPVNDAPIAVADSFTVNEGSTTNLDLAANDTDADDGPDLASIAIVAGPANGSIVVNADGTVDYTHDGSETVADSFTYTIDDMAGETSNTVTVTLTITPVNDAPIAVVDSFTVNEGSTTNLDLATNDTDADDGLDLTSIAIVSGPTNGSIVVNADGMVDYTHDGSETVADSFTYTIDDLSGATSNTVTVTLTITSGNDAPIAVADNFTVNEGSTTNLDLASNDTDADDGLDLTSIAIVSGPANGSIVVNADGTVDYTHDGSETVADSFTYTIDDLAGAASNTVTVSLTITPVNDAPIAVADSFTVNEGSTTSLDLVTNDTDADDGLDLTSIAIVSGPANGSIVVNADGTVDYTHNGSETVADSFTYTIDDIAGVTSNMVTVSLTITPINDDPIAVADNFTVNEGSTTNLDLAANDSDADDGLDLASIAIVSGPPNGSIVVNADGTVDYTHDGSETLADSFTYTIDDLTGATSNTVTVSLTITPVNDAPIATADGFTVDEGSTTNLDLAANDTDADDGLDLASISIVSGPINGSIVVNADGTVDYTHDGSGTVADSFTYAIDDLSGATSNTVTVSLTVTPVNDAPIAVADNFTVDEGSTTNLDLAANDTDADDGLDLATISIVSGPSNGSIVVNADGTVDYTHDDSETLSDSFMYTIDDLAGATSNTVTVSLTITPVNDAPIATADGFTVDEGSTTNLDLAANDSDADDGLNLASITIVSDPANGSIVVNADGTVDYTHDGSETVADSFTYTIDDIAGTTSNTVTVSLTVTPINDVPIATADGFTVDEGSTTNLDLAANDTDVDDGLDLASITIVTGPANGSIVVNVGGTVDYTHDGSETVADSFTYTIGDIAGATSNTVTVSLTITPVNDAPIATADGFTVDEASTTNIDLAADDTDADDGLDLSSITIISGPSNGSIVVNADGTVDYTHDGSETIADSFTYTIDDVAGATSNTVTVSLTITPINDAPISVADSFTVNEGSTTNLDLAINDTDADDGLDLTSIAIVSGPANGPIVVNVDGTVDYTHDGSETVADSFTYTIDDIAGATSNTVTVSLTITPVNDVPIAVADSFTVNEGSTTNLDLAANDTDVDDGLDLTSIAIVSGPANGSIVVNADGTVDYTHDGSEMVADSFTYTIDDLTGATSNTVTVSLTITPVNDAPIAVADSFTVDEGNTANLDLVANDTDADDGLELASITIATGPTNGSIVVNADGTVDYTHDGSETVADSFTYTIDDLTGATSNTVTVSLTITPVNDAPIAVADSFTVNEGSTTNLDLAANDTDADDGLDLTSIAIVSGPANGFIVVNADGTVDYTHDGSETVADSFTYTIDDLAGATSNTVTVSLTITPINDAPIAVADSFTVNEDSTTNLDLATNDTDADDGVDLSSIAIVSGPTNGSLVVNADGTVDYTHDGSETIADSFTYTIDDIAGATSNTVTVSLTVTPINDAPIATADGFTVDEGSMTNLDLAANDTDVDDGLDLASITIVTGPSNGSIVVNADGTVDYTHDGSETIADSFTYIIDDLSGTTSNTVTVSLTITPVNEAPIFTSSALTSGTENTAYSYTVTTSDNDGDSVVIFTTTLPAWLSLVDNGDGTATLSGTPTSGQVGDHMVVLQVSDGALTDAQSFTLSVSGATTSDPPDDDPEPVDTTDPDPIDENPDPDEIPDPGEEDPTFEDPVIEDEPLPIEEEYLTPPDDSGADDPLVHMEDTEEESEEIIFLSEEDDTGMNPHGRSDDRSYIFFDHELSKDITPSRYLNINFPVSENPSISDSKTDFNLFEFDSENSGEIVINSDYDFLRQEIDDSFSAELKSQAVKAKIVTITAASFTAGFVSYLLRAGSMVASFMSVLPAWRGLDPLVIFSRDKKKQKKEKEIPDKGEPISETLFDGEVE